ncbi:unnamed protein product [Hermetia illucens]|uniref:Large ribosomal subunit protein bL34m n=1 Tax=Hermetia illucens TaxID=343691 RepID=A0A7R8UBC8_HERIL|nr:39S ribosomal protein L34, mitochondrial [Hermetia illucens]CAD7077585.1 unnamed protein product [Hermetia illucens]
MANILMNITKRCLGSSFLQVAKVQPVVGDGIEMGAGGLWSYLSMRTKIRCYFPRPNEVKRIRVHGWEKRMSTPAGRRVLMRRILKGRHVLSH